MKFHLTPAIEVTPDSVEITHMCNTETRRVYSMGFTNPKRTDPNIITEDFSDAINIELPLDICKPMDIFITGLDQEFGPKWYTAQMDPEDENAIKQLFYEFCHNHMDKHPSQKFAYVYDIEWANVTTDEELPTDATVDISKAEDIHEIIQIILQYRYHATPMKFKTIEYTPYEEPHIGIIFEHHTFAVNGPRIIAHICEPNNGKITCTSVKLDFGPNSRENFKDIIEKSKNDSEAVVTTLENNELCLASDNRKPASRYWQYCVMTDKTLAYVPEKDFMATMHMTVTERKEKS